MILFDPGRRRRIRPPSSCSIRFEHVQGGKVKTMSLSQLARTIKESATLKLNETAAQLREKGAPIIHM